MFVAAALIVAGCAGDSDRKPIHHYLVYTSEVGGPNKSILIGDLEGRKMRRLTRGEYGLVSPDGGIVAIARGAETRTIRPDGRGEELVGRGKPAGWFSDSRHLLVFRGGRLLSVDIEGGDSAALVADVNLMRGWSVSPSGSRLAYALAEKESPRGACDEDVDVYLVGADGGSRDRLTHDGRSSDPIWGDERIAFAREPQAPPCVLPKAGIWAMREDGSDVRALVPQAPRRFAWNGYYGLRPHGWVSGRPLLLAGVRTEWGDELALVDLRSRRIRRPDLDPDPRYRRSIYVDQVSRDGRHVLGLACGAEYPCTIQIFSVTTRRYRNVITGQVGDPDWNR